MKKNLLIWGCGGHANIVVEQCRYGNYKMIDDTSTEYLNKTWLKIYPKEEWDAFIAIGDNVSREKVFNRLRQKKYDIVNVISRDSYISPTVELGCGIYVAPMACIMTHTKVGDGCIINTNSSVDHDCRLGSFVHISPCACLGGNVEVGNRTWIGLGSSVIHRLYISSDSIVAGGSSVANDLSPSHSLFAGNPAVFKKSLLYFNS